MTNFAERLTELRTKKGVSRIELAAAMGLPRLTIEKYETGRVTPPKELQEKLAAYFGVTLAYLRGESDESLGMGSWLSGNVPEEPEPVRTTAVPKKAPVSKQAEDAQNGAVFNLLLKSDAFKNAVLEVLKTPEGQKLIKQAMQSKY